MSENLGFKIENIVSKEFGISLSLLKCQRWSQKRLFLY